jgi:hypothetical protein
MRRQVLVLAMLSIMAAGTLGSLRPTWPPFSQEPCKEDNARWVGEALTRMQSVRPGMTRADLLRLFGTEGGLSTGLRRTYVSRDCPYFKVDVEFHAVGRAEHDGEGRVTLVEDNRDIIANISKPYLEFSITD